MTGRMRVATYNVHAGIGRDRRRNFRRIAAVIAELGADVVALQEVSKTERPEDGHDGFLALDRAFGGFAVEAPALVGDDTLFGNMLLSRWPVRESDVVSLALPGREPRNAIHARIETPSGPVRVITAHFGLDGRERSAQARIIGGMIERDTTRPVVVAGDLNDWWPGSGVVRQISRSLGGPAWPHGPRSFPSGRPLLSLDRILCRPAERIQRMIAHGSSLARTASDHLPVVADILLD